MHLLTGYTKPITALAVSPDGTWLFSASRNQTMVWQWDLVEGAVAQKLRNPEGRPVVALAVSPPGDFFVAASAYSAVWLWPTDGGRPRRLDQQGCGLATSPRPCLAVHPTRRLVLAPCFGSRSSAPGGVGSGFQTWDLHDNDRHERWKSPLLTDYVLSLALSPCGRRLALTTQRPITYLWDLDGDDGPRAVPLRFSPTAVAFRPDGQRLAVARATSGSVAGAPGVSVFDMPSGTLIEDLQGQDGDLRSLAYSPDGRHLAIAASDGVVTLRDAATHEVVGRRHLDLGELGPMAWLPDSSRLVVGGEKLIAVCRRDELLGEDVAKPPPRGEPLTVKASTSVVEDLSYSPDGRKLVGWAPKSRMFIWDMSGGAGRAKLAARFKPSAGMPFAASWSPDGERLALSFSFTSLVCDARTGVPCSDPLGMVARDAHFAAFTPEGRLLVNRSADPSTGGSTLVELWGADGQRLFAKQVSLETPDRTVTHAVSVSGDRQVYLAVERNGVYRWSPAGDEVARLFGQNARVATLVVREERLALTTGGKNALVWALPEGKCRGELKHPLTCSGAAFLPGGRIITACYDGIVRVWDEAGGEMMALDLGMGKIFSFAVSPDHMTFAAGVEKKDGGMSRVVLMDVPE